MKTLEKFASKHGLTVVKIRYRDYNSTSIGYDLISENKAIQVQFKPVNYSNKDRWLIDDKTQSVSNGIMYAKTIQSAIKQLSNFSPVEFTGWTLFFTLNNLLF